MRLFWILFILLLIGGGPARAEQDYFVSLGVLQMMKYPSDGRGAHFPAGTKAKLLKIDNGKVIFDINGKKYSTTQEAASYYFESANSGQKYLIGEALNVLYDPNALVQCPSCMDIPHYSGCPWKNGEEYWSPEALRRAISICPIDKISIIYRKMKGNYSEGCRNDRGLPEIEDGSYSDCAAPPACKGESAALKRRQAQLRHEDAKMLCTDPKNRKKPSLEPEEKCLLPFQEPITKLVIHQTDGPSDRGPGEIFNWHRDRNFDDVSYHFIIAKDASGKWRAFEGRPREYEGAHGGPGANSDSLGIAIAGCFKSEEPQATSPCVAEGGQPPPEAVRVLSALVAKLKKETVDENGNETLKEVLGHGQHRYAQTKCHSSCPSPGCQMIVNRLQERFFGGQI